MWGSVNSDYLVLVMDHGWVEVALIPTTFSLSGAYASCGVALIPINPWLSGTRGLVPTLGGGLGCVVGAGPPRA